MHMLLPSIWLSVFFCKINGAMIIRALPCNNLVIAFIHVCDNKSANLICTFAFHLVGRTVSSFSIQNSYHLLLCQALPLMVLVGIAEMGFS